MAPAQPRVPIVTPRMHAIHHSDVREETESNWSSFSIWDIIHGTFRIDVPQERITIGVPRHQRPEDVTAGRVLALPLRPTAGDGTHHARLHRVQRLSGSELRSRRIRLGLSRDRIAHAVGVPITTVSEWEEDATPIACPHAVEQVLRQKEDDVPVRFATSSSDVC